MKQAKDMSVKSEDLGSKTAKEADRLVFVGRVPLADNNDLFIMSQIPSCDRKGRQIKPDYVRAKSRECRFFIGVKPYSGSNGFFQVPGGAHYVCWSDYRPHVCDYGVPRFYDKHKQEIGL